MLQHLEIENYALIDHLEISFPLGLSTITGETGAGKSILLGAIGMLLGQRTDTSVLKKSETGCIIEGEFLMTNQDLQPLFEENDIEFSKLLTIRRQISATGKSRAFINDTPVTLNVLKSIGESLIDIHSQHQNLLLQRDSFQLRVIDSLANNNKLLKEYQQVYSEYKKAERELLRLKEQSNLSKSELDYFQFQYNELLAAQLKHDEQALLEEELEQLTHAEEIKSKFSQLVEILSAEEFSIISNLTQVNAILHKTSVVFGKAESLAIRSQSCLIELKDLCNDIEEISEVTEVNPERLHDVNARLDIIFSLQRKHKVDNITDLLKIQHELQGKLTVIDNFEEHIARQEQAVDSLHLKLSTLAEQLTLSRQNYFETIEEHVVKTLAELGMPNAQFKVSHQLSEVFTNTGKDTIVFLFSGNKGTPLQEISDVASGGEMSRLMLTLKSLVAFTGTLPTIIFDEIDTGVSGEIANKMGKIIAELGKSIQVLNITHLPQIASKGEQHYLVYKQENQKDTTTHIRLLTKEERVLEIAKMLSGNSITDIAVENAKILLNN